MKQETLRPRRRLSASTMREAAMSLFDRFHADPHLDETYKGRPLLGFELEKHAGRGEIRRYTPHLFAAVTARGPQDEAFEKGFATLTDYACGGNADEVQVPVAVPASQFLVAHGRGCADGREWRVAVPIPLDRPATGVATPEDPSVTIRRARHERLAIWRLDPDEMDDPFGAETCLRGWLEGYGIVPLGQVRLLFHDDPLTPADRRRTEIALPV